MAFDLNSITTGRGLQAPRIILLGTPKIGKSEFAAGSNNPIFIPIHGEEGIDSIEVPQFPTCDTLSNVMECFKSIRESDYFKTIVLDSASTLEPLLHANTCARCPLKDGSLPRGIEAVHGGYSKGYVEALTEWRMITDTLDMFRKERGVASIIVGHVIVRRFDDPAGLSYDQWQFDINQKAAGFLYKWADCILFCNKKTAVTKEDVGFGKEKQRGVDVSGGQHYLYTKQNPAHPGGGRGVFGRLPYELPLSWTAFQDAVSAQLVAEGQK
jgi:hypothetical protein